MYQIKTATHDPYDPLIENFVFSQFAKHAAKTCSQTMEMVAETIFATSKVRYGPKPSPESQVVFHEIICHYMKQNLPIPFVCPWGSEKPDGSIIDIAELGALKTLCCLNARVKDVYTPGAEFSLRVEDLCAPHLFFEQMAEARLEAKLYTDGLIALVKILSINSFITVSPDSLLSDEPTFNTLADQFVPIMETHLHNLTNPVTFKALTEIGWDKPVAQETVNHYLAGYEKLYPNRDLNFKLHVLARYFASSLARKKMGMTGILPRWNGKCLDLYFGKTPPGLEPTRYLRRIHYRTLPCSLTSNHMAPWRAKGYLAITNENEVTPKLASFQEDLTYNQREITLASNDTQVTVKTDYVLED
jgi:hypothetical protein